MTNLVKVENKQVVAGSRDVAGNFDKLHKNIIQSIENLTAENLAVKDMFFKTTYINERGREYPEYLMNRDGFTLLVMGFTGSKALEFKLAYMEAFNKMEEELRALSTPSYVIADPIERAMRWIQERQNFEKVALAYKKASDERNYLAQKVISYEERLEKSKSLHTVTLIAGKFGLTANKLNPILVEQKIQYKEGEAYHLYEDYKDKGLAEHVVIAISEDKVIHNLKWTEKGFHFTVRLLRSMGYTTEAPIQNPQTHLLQQM